MQIMKYFYKIYAVLSLFFAILGIFTLNIFLILLCGGAAWYLWRLSQEEQISKDGIPKPAEEIKNRTKLFKGLNSLYSKLIRGLYYFCLIFSILSLLIFSWSTFWAHTYLLSSGNWNIHPEPFWSIIVLLGLLLLIFYFIYKIKGYPFLLNASKGDDQNSEKSPHVPLIAILLLGIFLAWLISISFFTFGAINSPNDGKCDYDNENAVVFFLSAQENSIHVQEFCFNHIQFYTMLNPLYILSLPLKLTPHSIIDLTGLQFWAKFSIVIWVIFLLFVLASSVNFSNQDSEGFFIWKRHDSSIKPLIFGILGGLSFMVSFILTCQMIYMIHVLGNSGFNDALAMSAGSWPVYFILVLPCIVFTISIIRDARQ